jgi:hypothetical protein
VIESAIPPERKVPERTCPVMTDEIKHFVEAILTADKTASRKQRHTAHRIWQRMRRTGFLGGRVDGACLRGRRRRELGLGQRVFVPQHHEIRAQAEAECSTW